MRFEYLVLRKEYQTFYIVFLTTFLFSLLFFSLLTTNIEWH